MATPHIEFADPIAAFDRLSERLKATSTGCFEWTGSTDWSGYGQIVVEGRKWMTHRLMYRLANGELPAFSREKGAQTIVCHTCDNPPCCNPGHLYLGTQKNNGQDRADRCRMKRSYWQGSGQPSIIRTFGTVYWEIGGEIATLAEWSGRLGVNTSTLDARLRAGWAIDRLTDPTKTGDRTRAGATEYRRFSGFEAAERARLAQPAA
jgi:hypothetical protein